MLHCWWNVRKIHIWTTSTANDWDIQEVYIPVIEELQWLLILHCPSLISLWATDITLAELWPRNEQIVNINNNVFIGQHIGEHSLVLIDQW